MPSAELRSYSTIGYINWGYNGNDGKENGNYYSIIGFILGLYRDNGKTWKLLFGV